MEVMSIFSYNGSKVTFRSENELLYINATEMAKPFGKQVKDWKRLKSTEQFVASLSAKRQISLLGLFIVNQGGANPGTWMHEDVALEFARWLSPEFAIWCNDRIKELLTKGSVSLQPTSEDAIILQAMQTLQARVERQTEQLRLAESTIQQQAPKVQYCNEVLQSQSTYTTTTIAKELGMGAPTLHQQLKQRKVIYKHNGMWVLYYAYQGRGLTQTRTHIYTNSEGKTRTNVILVWTEKGRAFIHSLLNPKVSSPSARWSG